MDETDTPGPAPWGEDPKLVGLLGAQGAAQFRALFDGFPEAVGILWAMRDDDGRIVDFSFGYGNPSMLRSFRVPPTMRGRYTLLEALPHLQLVERGHLAHVSSPAAPRDGRAAVGSRR